MLSIVQSATKYFFSLHIFICTLFVYLIENGSVMYACRWIKVSVLWIDTLIRQHTILFNFSVCLHSLNMSVAIILPIIHTSFQINSILNAKWNSIKYGNEINWKSSTFFFLSLSHKCRLALQLGGNINKHQPKKKRYSYMQINSTQWLEFV